MADNSRQLLSHRWAVRSVLAALAVALVVAHPDSSRAQDSPSSGTADYVVGPQDVLTITSYDQADLSGKFTLETDGSFTYPYVGRVSVGGQTLRQIEASLKKALIDGGFFRKPQITVAVETYRSQKIFVVGEVRAPGTQTLSGNMTLVEALARAGSTLPSAGSEAIIVHANGNDSGPKLPGAVDEKDTLHIDLRELSTGSAAMKTLLRDGDTVVIPQAQTIYVSGQVKSPGAYPLQQLKTTTVLQALSLAGGMTDRGSDKRIQIIRVENGVKKELQGKLSDIVEPGDTIVVKERFF